MEVLEKTESICPECLKEGKIVKIPAELIEEDDKIYIVKTCEKHGTFKDIVFSDSRLYHKWIKYKIDGDGVENVEIKSWLSPEEQLYPKHLSQSVLTNIMLTNRCNLRCSYCFMNAGASGYVYEPTLDEIRMLMEQVRKERPVPSKAIQLTGGEPTVRDDLIEIIKMAKELGFVHVQLNTNGIKLSEDIELCRKIKEAGVNTIYMSFDGVSKETNPWIEQNKKAIENLREVGLNSIVLVPVVMKKNLNELADIIKYAIENNDVVRGVNFQPIAFAGRLEKVNQEFVRKNRVDYAEMLKAIEEGFDGQITMDDFYPVPFVYPISKLVENLKGEKQVEFTANPMCGGATYVFIDDDGKITPITRFIDVEGLMKFIDDLSKESGKLKKVKIVSSLIKNLGKYIDKEKAPKGFNIVNLLIGALTKGDYDSLGAFHHKSLYIGTMWFQDPWDLNLSRLKRCVIHYTTFEGVIPFCAYNGLGLGEEIRKKHSIPVEEWEKRTGRKLDDDLWKNGPIS